jgi:hypothetical protein
MAALLREALSQSSGAAMSGVSLEARAVEHAVERSTALNDLQSARHSRQRLTVMRSQRTDQMLADISGAKHKQRRKSWINGGSTAPVSRPPPFVINDVINNAKSTKITNAAKLTKRRTEPPKHL